MIEHPDGTGLFGFRHALLRDIAYRSLLRRNRRQIHLRAAAALAERQAAGEGATDDLIARHYSLGENYADAVRFRQHGANAAIARSAHEEALAILHAVAGDLRKLKGGQWVAVELEVVLAQAVALRSLRGYAAPEVEERLLRGRELCIACGDTKNRFNVEWGLFQCTLVQRDITGAQRLADDLFEHAERHPDRPLVDAWLASGMAAQVSANYAASKRLLETAVSLSRPETDPPNFFTHGQNPGLFSLSYLSRTLCYLGLLDQARASIGRCLAIAARRAGDPGHLHSHVNALVHAARVYNHCGDLATEKRFAEEARDIAARNHFSYYEAVSLCHLGWITGCQGSLTEGTDMLLAGLAGLVAIPPDACAALHPRPKVGGGGGGAGPGFARQPAVVCRCRASPGRISLPVPRSRLCGGGRRLSRQPGHRTTAGGRTSGAKIGAKPGGIPSAIGPPTGGTRCPGDGAGGTPRGARRGGCATRAAAAGEAFAS